MALCTCCFSACGDDDDENTTTPPASVSPIVGTWVEEFDDGSNLIQVTTFIFRSDGTGTQTTRYESSGSGFTLDPTEFTYSYNEETETIRLKFDGNGTLYTGTASITGNTLILRYNDTYYSLRKQ